MELASFRIISDESKVGSRKKCLGKVQHIPFIIHAFSLALDEFSFKFLL
jgi:hypothetical protein